jgi:hypothetical protein
VVSNTGVLADKTVTAIAGNTILCSDGTLVRLDASAQSNNPLFLVDPNGALQGKTILAGSRAVDGSIVLFKNSPPPGEAP